MSLNLHLWIMIPCLMVFTLLFFGAFENYTIQEWLMGNEIDNGETTPNLFGGGINKSTAELFGI